jgi:hypothetical protein
MDQGLFTAPHGLSQCTTSFIASCCQGIHQTPFSRLIRSGKSKAEAFCATASLLERDSAPPLARWLPHPRKRGLLCPRHAFRSEVFVHFPAPGEPGSVRRRVRRRWSVYQTWNSFVSACRPQSLAASRLVPPHAGNRHETDVYLSQRCQTRPASEARGRCVRKDDRKARAGRLGDPFVFWRRCGRRGHLVGRGGLEPPTLRLSGVRSNHLSYRPDPGGAGPALAGGAGNLVEPTGIEPVTS